MPFNDAKLIYDFDSHRYILNHESNGEHVNVAKAYGSIENIKSQLRSISRTIYNYIYSHSHSGNRYYLEMVLATDESLRNVIYDAMLSQLIADVESGVDSVKNQAGINIETGQVIDRTLHFRNIIAPEVELILLTGNGKFNLLYAGDYGVRLPETRYEERSY
jgi:hypothetical protein